MNKRMTNDERAVSGLVGEIMLIGIVILAIGLITVSAYSYLNKDPDPPHIEVNGLANLVSDEIYLKHQGGELIEGGNLRVLVNVDGTTLKPFDDDADNSDRWGIKLREEDDVEHNFDRWTLGDILVLATNMTEHPVDLTEDSKIRVTIVHRPSNRVAVSGEVFGGLFGKKLIHTALPNMVFEIVNPTDGDWVKNVTELIEAHVIGTDGYDRVDFSICLVSSEVGYSLDETDDSGVTMGNTTGYTHNWNTTDIECGNHTIRATAYDSVWQPMTDQITVCVCNVPGLVGFWRFDDGTDSATANDSSCNRNHGTITGSPAQAIDGAVYAYQFDGSGGDYVKVANSTSLAMTNETTINSSVNSSDAGEQYILAKGDVVFELADEVVRQNVSNPSWDPAFGAGYKRAQTFKPAANSTLSTTRVDIKKATSSITGDVNVAIYTDGVTHPGSEIATYTISDSSIGDSFAWHDASFDCALVGGTTYWLVLESPAAFGGGDYCWTAGWPTDYSDGEAWYYNYTISSWTTDGLDGADMTFELNITTTSTYTDRISMPDPDNFKFIAYYGWLNGTGLNWSESGLKMVLIEDDNQGEIQEVRDAGVDVYFYIELGVGYCKATNKSVWEQNVTDFIDNHTYVDGFVLDDLDSGFWNNLSKCNDDDNCNTDDFNERLTRINTHVHSNTTLNQKTIANGVRYYADHCGSDYYMWESFMSSNDSITYYYDDFFNGTSRDGTPWEVSDPTVWINGVQKYKYLEDNGVLNRTLAHCYGPANEDDRSIYAYIASRVLGMKGFSYAEIHNFATEPLRIAEGLKWDLGTRMNHDIDSDAGTLSGRFTNGAVVDWVNQTVASNSLNYTTDMISDPLTAHLLDDSSLVTGLDFCLIRGQVDFMHGVLRSSTDLTGDPGYHVLSATLDAENGTATLHIDGTLAAKRTFPAGLPFDFSNQNLTIGSDGTCGFNGTIDDIKIYNYAT